MNILALDTSMGACSAAVLCASDGTRTLHARQVEMRRGHAEALMPMVQAVIAEAGIEPRGILIVSSYLPELLGICDRIAVMCRGHLGRCHDVAHVDEHQLMLEATGAEGLV